LHVISKHSADEAWREAAQLLLESDDAAPQSSRAGDTVELLHLVLHIEDPSQRWVTSRTPAINPAFALVEVFWIASGRQDAALPNYWNPALPRFCGTGDEYHGAYGYRLRQHFGIDQLDRVYSALASSPDSRQCVLQIWDSAVDLPHGDGTPASPDIPCNVLALPKIRRGKLEWMQIIRSNDLFLGMPHNIVQFSALQEMLSGWLGVSPGAYHQLSDSLHVYSKDLEAVRSSVQSLAGPRSTDSFALDRRTWDKVMPEAIARLESLTRENLSPSEFKTVAFGRAMPAAYDNSVLVAAADAARRRGWHDLAEDCMCRCTNPALVDLWSRWRLRCETMRQSWSTDGARRDGLVRS
jgi:thymidylate synthase